MPDTIDACRSCGYVDLQPVLSLGETPLANALLTQAQLHEPEETYALDLVFCSRCTLAQITVTVPPEKLFREYLYLSSFSDTLLQHAETIATHLTKARQLNENSLVVEVASNDGYLLQYYQRAGIPVIGIEPARNIADVARQRGIPVINEFFSDALAKDLTTRGQRADVIHAHNVLAHVADLNDVVAAFATLLKPEGVIVVEVPYVKDLIEHCEFDTIYHEHICYFSLTALNHLFQRHELTIVDVEHHQLHGGTLRIYAGHANNGVDRRSSVSTMLDEESGSGLGQLDFYHDFGARVEDLRRELVDLLRRLKDEGKRVAAYGASAKGSTLLNYFQLGADALDFVVDRSTVKQGYYTPGTHLPIYAPEKLLADMPDYVLLLTWNFASEILAQQTEYRARGGRFIVPIPSVRVI
jgi:SAM-dependent methyltransferase